MKFRVVSFLTASVALPAASLFLLISPARAASILDIGAQYRLRGITLSNADYGVSTDQDFRYYSQRAMAHIGGRFSPNLEMMTKFQAIGIAGSSQTTISNPAVNPAGDRYPNTNFVPWIQWAYFKASQLYDLPIDVTVGRQPIQLGDGLVLADDDLGFTGFRLQSRLPWWGLRADAFAFKTSETFFSTKDADVYGLEVTKPTRNVRYQVSWVMERDATGVNAYIRPSENILNAPASDYRASRIRRSFYDARVEGRLLEGGFYKTEFALQSGRVNRSSPTLESFDLGGYTFLFSAGLYTRRSKFGPIEVHATFGQASGDGGEASKDNSFRPSFGHRFDGLERSGFGELFGGTLYDAFPSSAYPRGLPHGYSGVRVIGGGITTHPTSLLSIGIDYFVYDAMENLSKNFPTTVSPETSLGSEFDLGIGFAYTNYLSFRASAAFFAPGDAFPKKDRGRRFLVEAVGRF